MFTRSLLPRALVFPIVLSLGCSSVDDASPEVDEPESVELPIRDATPVPEGQLLAMLEVHTSLGYCSGMLIATDTVLTAAHCFCTQNVVGGNVCSTTGQVTFQDNPTTGAAGPTRSATVTIHPAYDPSVTELQIENDLAVMKLSSVAPSYVVPFVLATNHPPTGATVKVVGFGNTGEGCSGSLGRLNYDQAKLDAFEDDHKIMRFNDPVICGGDSGGAVMDAAGTKLHGVHSNAVWTLTHGMVSKSIVSSTYFDWIKSKTCSSTTSSRCDDKATMCRCKAGFGDCDSDTDCVPPLKCRANVGASFGYSADTDVCLAPGPVQGTCGCQNSGAGNICTTSFNGCSAGFVPHCDPLRGTPTNGCGACECQ